MIAGQMRLVTAVYDPATKKLENHNSEKDVRFSLQKSCLVPGGKYLCLFDPDFCIVNRPHSVSFRRYPC